MKKILVCVGLREKGHILSALKSVQSCQQKKRDMEIFNSDLTCRRTRNEIILCYCTDCYFGKKYSFLVKKACSALNSWCRVVASIALLVCPFVSLQDNSALVS